MATEILAWPRPEWWAKFYLGPGGCWIWTGPRKRDGYGQTGVVESVVMGEKLVHRITYRLFIGPIPRGFVLDHLCEVRPCGNPWHLEAVTSQENRRRARPRGPAKHRYTRSPPLTDR